MIESQAGQIIVNKYQKRGVNNEKITRFSEILGTEKRTEMKEPEKKNKDY